MAVNISIELLKKRGLFYSLRSRPLKTIFFRIKRFVFEKIRVYRRKKIILKLEPYIVSPPTDIILGKNFEFKNLEIVSEQYASQNYAFIENFFSQDTYNKICDSFPHEVFFNYPRNGSKFYSWSEEFRWIRDDNNTTYDEKNAETFFHLYPTFKKLFNFLNSEDMSEKVKIITNSHEAQLYSIALTRAKEGSFLSPHTDTISTVKKPGEKIMMNFIYFLIGGGSSPVNSGGTSLYHDNEFNKLIFTPPTIKNSALLYDSIEQFHHGFDVMAPGSFRWSIVFQYKLL